VATICKELSIDAGAAAVWNALRDFGAVHERVAPGFVVATQFDGDARIVTFGNGTSAREQLIASDDAARRLVYGVVGGRFTPSPARTIKVYQSPEGLPSLCSSQYVSCPALFSPATVRPSGRSTI